MASRTTLGICQLYDGASIFIMGGSGTVGKILLEKILRSCPGVERIYVLIRNKRNRLAADRLGEALDTELFSKLSEVCPNFRTKCVAVTGDTRLPKLGISEEDEDRLVKDVSIVFNLAANVRFDNVKLSDMIADNVSSVRKLITLCTKMKKLKALVHASTTYCHNEIGHIQEVIYPCATPPSDIIALADNLNLQDSGGLGAMSSLVPMFVCSILASCGDHLTTHQFTHPAINYAFVTDSWGPVRTFLKLLNSNFLEKIKLDIIQRTTSNEYMFTKALAENLLATEGRALPVCMVRIPGVAATLHDPFPGWIDGLGSISGFVVAVGSGVLRHMMSDPTYVTEILPADMVASFLIAAGWWTAVSPTEECTVYNMASASDNRSLSVEKLGALVAEYTRKTPFSKFFREPFFTITRNKTYVDISDTLNMLQAYVMDLLMGHTGHSARSVVIHRRRLLKMYRGMSDYMPLLSFDSSNVIALWGRLSNAERQVFNFDRKLIDWPKYIELHCLGVKRHVMKDDMSKIEDARLFLQRWRLFWTVIQVAVLPIIIFLLLVCMWVM